MSHWLAGQGARVIVTEIDPICALQADMDGYHEVYVLPKHLEEKVARLHLDAMGVRLTELTKVQAEYLGVDVAGPFKADSYRY